LFLFGILVSDMMFKFVGAVLIVSVNLVQSLRLSSSKSFTKVVPITSFFAVHSSTVNDKVEVEEYFNNEGFNRWNKIYSDSGEVNKVQLDIRTGHQQTIDKVLGWLSSEENSKKTICDAGCGVGSLSLPLSKSFKQVFASDISSSMTNEAAARAKQSNIKNIKFQVFFLTI